MQSRQPGNPALPSGTFDSDYIGCVAMDACNNFQIPSALQLHSSSQREGQLYVDVAGFSVSRTIGFICNCSHCNVVAGDGEVAFCCKSSPTVCG